MKSLLSSTRPSRTFCVLLALCLLPTQANAQYLDPGASSILIQGIIAGVVAVAAAVKLYWWKISGFFSRNQRRDKQP